MRAHRRFWVSTWKSNFGGSLGLTGSAWGKPSEAYRPAGDIWAHSFWSTFAVPGVTINEAAAQATRDLVATYGQDYGYSSYRVLQQPGASATLTGK